MITILLVVLVGCARPTAAPGASAPREEAGSAAPQRAPTSISIVLPVEIGAFSTRLEAVGGNAVPSRYFHEFVNAYLTTRDLTNELAPWLAEELPSLDRGTWTVRDDGGMEVTWKLRRGVLWHDGTEMTSSDVKFGWEAARDPITQISTRGISRHVERVDTPDRYTAVFRWKQSNQLGNEAGEDQFEVLPRHLLESALLASKEDFQNQPFFTSPEAFVGLGPYRPTLWERGSHITVEAFDRYFLGRPKIDRVTFKFIRDSQTAMAQLLSGAADIAYQAPAYENARIIAEQWAKSDGGTVFMQLNRVRMVHPQFRPEFANPPDLLNPTVRKALALALDRQSIAEATVPGSAQVADSLTYEDAIGRAVSQTLVRYPYDPSRALALLEEAGWRRPAEAGRPDGSGRGSDGALIKGGERLSLEYRYNVQADAEALYPVLRQSYQQVGMETSVIRLVGPATTQEHAQYPGVIFSGISATIPALMSRFQSSQIASAQNRYAGANNHGYHNAEADRLLATIDASVRVEDRVRSWAQLWRILSDDVAVIPMYYFPSPYVVRKGISGALPANPIDTPTYLVHTWELQ